MTDTFPAITSKQMISILEHQGFRRARETGSGHVIYVRDSDKCKVTVARHSKVILKRKVLKSILNQMGLTLAEFKELLK